MNDIFHEREYLKFICLNCGIKILTEESRSSQLYTQLR